MSSNGSTGVYTKSCPSRKPSSFWRWKAPPARRKGCRSSKPYSMRLKTGGDPPSPSCPDSCRNTRKRRGGGGVFYVPTFTPAKAAWGMRSS